MVNELPAPPSDKYADFDLGFSDDTPIQSKGEIKNEKKRDYEVGYGKPPKQYNIKKGQVLNPRGAGAHSSLSKAVKRLTAGQIAELGAHIVTSNLEGLQKVAKDPASSTLQVWIATVAIKGVKTGDMSRLDQLLNRLVGRVKETIELSGEGGGPMRAIIGAMTPEERELELERLRSMRKDAGND
jgi:hypothetical protein